MSENSAQNSEMYKPRKWYNNEQFPLIPVFTNRRPNEYNTRQLGLHWMFVRLWTLDSFEFEIAFVWSGHWGIGLTGILPYLRWAITIPFPVKYSMWAQRKLWRKPKKA